jgi:hypothetical protein
MTGHCWQCWTTWTGNGEISGRMFINFCEINGLVTINTWFKKPKRRQYTQKTPGY